MLRSWGWKCQVLPKWNTWQPSMALCDGRWNWGKRSQVPRVEGPPAIFESDSGRGAVPWLRGSVGCCRSWTFVFREKQPTLRSRWQRETGDYMERWADKEQKHSPGRKKGASWRRTKAEGDPTSLNLSRFLLPSPGQMQVLFPPPCTKFSYLADSEMNDEHSQPGNKKTCHRSLWTKSSSLGNK